MISEADWDESTSTGDWEGDDDKQRFVKRAGNKSYGFGEW